MGILGLVFLAVALVLVGVGIAVGLVACATAAVLLGLGVVSSSVFVGIRSGRPSSGLRLFLLQCGVLAGVPTGAVCAWLAHSFLETYGGILPVLIAGAFGGAFAGVIIALLLDFILRRGATWASSRFPLLSNQADRPNNPVQRTRSAVTPAASNPQTFPAAGAPAPRVADL